MRRVIKALAVLLIVMPAGAGLERKLMVNGAFQVKDAAEYLDYALAKVEIDQARGPEILWQTLAASVVQERMRGDRLWLRLSIENETARPARLVLLAGEARTDSARFYYFESGKLTQTEIAGDMVTRGVRPEFAAPKFSFTLAPRAAGQIYISVENPVDLAADFMLMRDSAFTEIGGRTYLMQGIFFGAILVLMLFYGAIYLSKRSRTVAAYLAYLVATGVFFAARTGLLYQSVGFYSAELMNVLVAPLPGLIYASGMRFTRAFLQLQQGSLSDRFLRIAQYISLVPVPLAIFSRHWAREACDWLSLIIGPGLLVFVWLIRRQSEKAKLYLLAWCWPILVSLLQYAGFDNSYIMRNVLLQTAMLVEFVFFAIFVGRDINSFEVERSKQSANLLMVQEDLEQARRVHATLLPVGSPDFRPLSVAQLYRPMSELGGDYYDWFRLSDDRLVLLVADVTGHGLPAALDAAVVHIAFQTAVVEATDPAEILRAMNTSLIAQGIDRCVSAVCAVFDAADPAFDVALAGHPQAIVVSARQAVAIGEYGPLLGFARDSRYVSTRMPVRAGDRLYLCTDGAYEIPAAESDDDYTQFAQMLAEKSHLPIEKALQATLEHFDRLRRGQKSDDVTLLGAEVVAG